MRRIPINILTEKEVSSLSNDVSDIVNDSQIRVKIILGQLTEGAYDPETGTKTETWTRDTVYAIRGEFSTRDLATQGNIELGDVLFLVRTEDYIDDLGVEIDREDQLLELKYSMGGVTVTNNSTSFSGVGTVWKKNIGIGDYIRLDGEETVYEINTIPTDTTGTFKSIYTGASKSSYPYEAYTKWQIINVICDQLDLVRKVQCRRVR